MDTNIILKYKNISTPNLKKKAQIVFNAWIRKRDEGQPCINCGRYTKLQSGHFFPTSTHNYLRFHEHNANGECLQCNYFNSQSHSYGYRVNLEKKLGKEDFDKLMQLGERKIQVKDDRFFFIEIIEKYKL
jgi:hypothetical protein